jgi:signal transduction histidine kinase
MAKEAIHNVVEHASAHEVHVAAHLHDTRLQISIADDGGGIGPGASTRGDGLANMRRRADDLGGRCEIGPRPGGGTLVTFDIPVPQGHSLA